jgi:hypothetical protein
MSAFSLVPALALVLAALWIVGMSNPLQPGVGAFTGLLTVTLVPQVATVA